MISGEVGVRLGRLFNFILFGLNQRKLFSGSKVQVVGYDPRPLIKITPPPSANDRRIQIYNYVEAVKTLPTNLPDSELIPIIRRINPKLRGQIRSLFIILSDDLYKPWPQSSGPSKGGATPTAQHGQPETSESESDGGEVTPEPVAPNPDRGTKRGASALKASKAKAPKASK